MTAFWWVLYARGQAQAGQSLAGLFIKQAVLQWPILQTRTQKWKVVKSFTQSCETRMQNQDCWNLRVLSTMPTADQSLSPRKSRWDSQPLFLKAHSFLSLPSGVEGYVSTEQQVLVNIPFWNYYRVNAGLELIQRDLASFQYVYL